MEPLKIATYARQEGIKDMAHGESLSLGADSSSAVPLPQVRRALKRLAGSLAALECGISRVEERVGAVLVPEEPLNKEKAQVVPSAQPMVPLAIEIFELADHAEECVVRLGCLVERVEV